MKRLLCFVSICALTGHCGATEPAGVPDYVGAVLREMDHSVGTSTSGLSGPGQPEEFFGGYVFKPASRDFAVIQDQIVKDVSQVIEAAGWTSETPHRDPIGSVPGRLILSGRKGSTHCEVVVFFFPVQDAKMGVSYSQITRKL